MSVSLFYKIMSHKPIVKRFSKYIDLKDLCSLCATSKKIRTIWHIQPLSKSRPFREKCEDLVYSREWREALRIGTMIEREFGVSVDIYKENPFKSLNRCRKKCKVLFGGDLLSRK